MWWDTLNWAAELNQFFRTGDPRCRDEPRQRDAILVAGVDVARKATKARALQASAEDTFKLSREAVGGCC